MSEHLQTAVAIVKESPSVSSVDIKLDPPSPRALGAKASSRFYRPELDSLRFLAFLGVFIFHVVPHDPIFYLHHRVLPAALVPSVCAISGAGAFGVDLFFVLSAYLITVLLLREKSARGHIDVKAFYVRRVLRIWPLYFFFISVALVLSLWEQTQRLPWQYIAGYLLLTGNWVYAIKGLPIGSVAIPLWSISIEEQFYLFWPPILRHTTRARLLYCIVFLLVLANLVRLGLVAEHVSGAAVEYNTFARIDALAFGILIGCFLGDRSPNLSPSMRLGVFLSSALTWVGVAMYAHLNAPQSPAPVIGTLIGRPLVALAAAGILFSFIGATGPMKILWAPILTYLGTISYGLYVYHMLALLLAEHLVYAITSNGHGAAAMLGFLFTISFSAFSYRYLEFPFLRLKNRVSPMQSRPI